MSESKNSNKEKSSLEQNKKSTNENKPEPEQQPRPPGKSGRPDEVKFKSQVSFVFRTTSNLDEFADIYNFCISLTSLPREGIISEIKTALRLRELKSYELINVISKLDKLCLKPIHDRHELHLNRKSAIKLFKRLVSHGNPDDLFEEHVIHLMWAMFTCLHHFQVRLKVCGGLITFFRRRYFLQTLKVYQRLLNFIPEQFDSTVIYCTMVFCKNGRLWKFEYLCKEILLRIINQTHQLDKVISQLISSCETLTLENVSESMQCLQIIICVLKHSDLETLKPDTVVKFLHMFRCSIDPSVKDDYNYSQLKNGLLACLYYLGPVISKESRRVVLQTFINYIREDPDEKVVIALTDMALRCQLIDSSWHILFDYCNALHGLIEINWLEGGITRARLLTKLGIVAADMYGNRKLFETPRMFLEGKKYNIKLGKKESQKLHGAFMLQLPEFVLNILKKFKDCREVLERIYCILCCLLCSYKTGLTAATITCLAIACQNYALEESKQMSFDHSCHIHIVVVCILSLVCYLFKAKAFYKYLNRIINHRAKQACHLLPPLRVNSEYPRHLILWNPPDFMFDKWQIRYGLWTCFKIKSKFRG